MAIVEIKGFKYYTDNLGNLISLIIEENKIESGMNQLVENNIKAINLTYFDSKNILDLDFLSSYPFVEEVGISDCDINIQGLYYLKNLKSLTLDIKNTRQILDLSKFENLEYLSLDWFTNFPDLSKNKKLRELYIWKFKPLSQSFRELNLPESIHTLHITDSNIKSLEGINTSSIVRLEAYYCSKIESLIGLKDISQSIKTLILENCKKLRNYEDLWKCKKIEKLILTNCGEISSIKKISLMPDLKMLSFSGTNIIDGDLSNCLNIDYVYFKNAKHYNHKMKEFEK